jgi:hypothetical protein
VQSLSIARQREAGLSADVKSSLQNFAKLLRMAKQKVRRVWDSVIQCNSLDLYDGTKRSFEAVDQCEASMRHIMRHFPNNRFVTRQYARFAEEILSDHKLAGDMIQKSRLLNQNILVTKDTAHE